MSSILSGEILYLMIMPYEYMHGLFITNPSIHLLYISKTTTTQTPAMTFQPTATVETNLPGLDTETQAFIQTLLQAAQNPAQPNLTPLKLAKPETYYGSRKASSPTPDTWLFQMKQYVRLQNQNPDHAIPFSATYL